MMSSIVGMIYFTCSTDSLRLKKDIIILSVNAFKRKYIVPEVNRTLAYIVIVRDRSASLDNFARFFKFHAGFRLYPRFPMF